MSSFRVRPRFTKVLAMSPKEFQEHIQALLKQADAPCKGRFIDGHIRLFVLKEEQHYWSPQLSISYEKDKNGTFIRGLYGPNPSVWALFFYGYAICGLVGMFAGMWGMALWSLEKDPWPLWLVLVCVIVAAALYVVAQTGQKLGAEQTFMLHHFFEDAVGERTHIE